MNAVVAFPAPAATEQPLDLVPLNILMTFGQFARISAILKVSERAPNLSREERAAVAGMILEIDAALRAAPF